MQMSRRRKTALASFAIVLAPVLSSCGFDYATDRDYTPGVGANDRSATVDVLAGTLVSDEDGQGVFIASLSNNSTEETISLEAVTSEDGATVTGVKPVELAPQGFANLASGDTKPIQVEGDFVAGNFVSFTLAFSNGEDVTLRVPVVRNCGYYAEIPGVPAGDERCPSGNDEGDH